MSLGHRAKAKFVEVFSADLRSLAVFRGVLALLVLASLAIRSTSLTAFYSDRGILPRSELLQNDGFFSSYSFSLNLLNGTPEFQAVLFGVTALAALSLLLGYRTRLSTFVVWLLVLSIQLRNPLTLNAGDHLLHLLLFWGIFLPLGAVWSLDRIRNRARETRERPARLSMRFFSMGVVALFLQIAFLYWFTAVLKTGEEWRDGTALYYTLSNDQLTTQLGSYLLNFPGLLMVLTFATILLEAFGPLLLFSPLFNGLARMAAIVSFMGLHFGIWLTMEVGMFPFVSAFCMVCFLPGAFWDRVLPWLRSLLSGRLAPARFGKPPGKRLAGHPQAGFLRAARSYLDSLWNWISSPVGMRNSYVYSLAGRNGLVEDAAGQGPHASEDSRSLDFSDSSGSSGSDEAGDRNPDERCGRDGTASGDLAVSLRSSLATNVLALLLVVYVFSWNVSTVSSFSMPTPAYPLGPFLGLSQSWGMFAPSPPRDDGWWVIPGELDNGGQTDLLSVVRGDYGIQKVSYDKPRDIAGSVGNEPWHKYLEFLTITGYEDSWRSQSLQREQRENFASYLCGSWNTRHSGGDTLESLRLVYIKETTLPRGQTPTTERLTLDEHSCG